MPQFDSSLRLIFKPRSLFTFYHQCISLLGALSSHWISIRATSDFLMGKDFEFRFFLFELKRNSPYSFYFQTLVCKSCLFIRPNERTQKFMAPLAPCTGSRGKSAEGISCHSHFEGLDKGEREGSGRGRETREGRKKTDGSGGVQRRANLRYHTDRLPLEQRVSALKRQGPAPALCWFFGFKWLCPIAASFWNPYSSVGSSVWWGVFFWSFGLSALGCLFYLLSKTF